MGKSQQGTFQNYELVERWFACFRSSNVYVPSAGAKKMCFIFFIFFQDMRIWESVMAE